MWVSGLCGQPRRLLRVREVIKAAGCGERWLQRGATLRPREMGLWGYRVRRGLSLGIFGDEVVLVI